MESFVLAHNSIAADQFAYLLWQRDTFGKYTNDAGMEELMILPLINKLIPPCHTRIPRGLIPEYSFTTCATI